MLSDQRRPVSAALEASIENDLRELPELALRIDGRNSSERYRVKLNAIATRLDARLREDAENRTPGSLGGYVDARAMEADLELMREIVALSAHPIQASGGIATIDDIRSLAELGVSSAIVGMALYTGALSAAQIKKEFNQ